MSTPGIAPHRTSEGPDEAEDLLAGLDPQQRAAVCAPAGSVVVHAGAGSGKTTVLTRRIAWRIAETDAAPEHVLAITFTRQAAGELRRRLRATGAVHRDSGRGVTAGTFHAVGWSLLRQRCLDTGKRVPVVATNRAAILSAVLERAETASIGAVLSVIDWAHARSVHPDALAETLSRRPGRIPLSPARLARVMTDYEALKVRRGVLDLDDMLSRVVAAAAEDSVFLESIRWQFRHVHVDEAQDMNPLQHRFLSLLVADPVDLFVVGDPNQAIYMWNGAEPRIFDELPETVPGTTVHSLGSNYRCTPQVVAAAVHLLGVSGQRADVVSRRPDGEPVRWVRCADEDSEARAVVEAVRDAHQRGVPWAAMAVLARTNALASSLAGALERAGVPVQSRVNTRGFMDAVAEASSLSGRHNLTVWSSDVLDQTTQSSDVLDQGAPRSDAPSVDDDTRAVARHVRDFLAAHPVGAVDGRMFAAWLRTQEFPDSSPGTEVMSIHAAKGREWTAVVVAGAENGLLPLAGTSGEAAREEARLAYVALTRACDRLTVTWTDTRNGKRTGPSPLMRGLDMSAPAPSAPDEEARRLIAEHRRASALASSAPDDSGAEGEARRALSLWRARQARAAGIAPEAVLTDDELARLAQARPADTDGVIGVIGQVLGRRHGGRIVEALASREA